MLQAVIIMSLCTLIAWAVGVWLCRRAAAVGLVQAPNERSSHVLPTPTGGGLGFVIAGSLAGTGLALLDNWPQAWNTLVLAGVLAVVGLRDDVRPVAARVRFGIQILVMAAFLFLQGNLPDLPGPLSLGWLLPAFLIVTGVWWINLFNFMDGIDGIAASQAICMLATAALLAIETRPSAVTDPAWIFMLAVIAALAGFLLLNWPPAKIFMGDVGSTWLAFIIFAIGLISVQNGWLHYATWLVLGALFVVDATMTLITRILQGERWYEGHRSHAYQRLSRRWQGNRKAGHRSVTLLVIATNLVWIAPWAWVCSHWPEWSLVSILAVYAPLVLLAYWLGAGKPDSHKAF